MSIQRSKFRAEALMFLLLFLVSAGAALAQDLFGCYRCAYPRLNPTSPSRYCTEVDDGETGRTTCSGNEDLGTCAAYGQTCFHTVVIDDPDDPRYGGGGGPSCVIGPASYCPAECPSCVRQLY